MHQDQDIGYVKRCAKYGVKEVSWKQHLAQLNKMSQHSNLDFAYQRIAAAYLLFCNQA
jgi:hypothetical protein